MARQPKSLWGKFADAMLDGRQEEAKRIMGQMSGTELESAQRWIDGPTAKQRQESIVRQQAINTTTQEEINRHCQFDGLL
jgi:uncharacterized lipoprotein YehR (DUF1307 family)